MLLPSILRILDQGQIQSKVVRSVESGFKAEMAAAIERGPGLEKKEPSIASAADAPKPLNLASPSTEKPAAGKGLEELLRIITKFEKSNQKRVVDFFE